MNSKFPYQILMLLVINTTFIGLSGCSTAIDPTELSASFPEMRFAPDEMLEHSDIANTVHVEFMLRGYCYAGSNIKDTQALGGFGKSGNMPLPITTDAAKSSGACYLLAQPNVPTRFGENKGMRLLLVNGTNKHVAFNASDSRLNLIQEAQDKLGNWKPIEYLPSSSCGNSYHRVILPSGSYWTFSTPRYEGEMETQLRFCMRDHQGKVLMTSNTFKGSINPDQFSNKQPYNSSNLMDANVQDSPKKDRGI